MASPQKVNIPQKEPMVMVDEVLSHTGIETVTRFVIRDDNVFVDNGLFTEPGLIENMAQTAAAGTGVTTAMQDKEAPVGFIGGISRLKINGLPGSGSELVTTATVMHTVGNATIIQAEVKSGDASVASCEMKIFLINQ
jgi:predicted hotdog family 3-hydroxylacyl-ACP dehydratase